METLPFNPYNALKSLVEVTAPHTGDNFLKAVCDQLHELFQADLVFITRSLDYHPSTKVKILHSTSSDVPKKFTLEQTPCELVYEDKIIVINENIRLDFEKEKETQFQSYYGIPLHDKEQLCIGHIAIFSNHKRQYPKELEDIALLFARRVETETMRLFLERKNEQTRRKLKRLSLIDPLTQIYNRRFFSQKCNEIFTQLQRENIHASIIYMDLDNFKCLNDTYGHDTGDFVLKSFGNILKKQSRKDFDFAARLGGEEFGIVCLYSNANEATMLAQRIQKACESFFENEKYTITASFGISTFSTSCQCWEEVFKQADEKMYEAKRNGKNTICV